MPKNYEFESDIIETPDALYAPGTLVRYSGTYDLDYDNTPPQERIYTVQDFAWDTLKKTWTYCLTRDTFGEDQIAFYDAPEADLISIELKVKLYK